MPAHCSPSQLQSGCTYTNSPPMQPPSATTLENTLKHKHNVCHIDLGTFICLLGDPGSSFFTIAPTFSMYVDCKSTSFHSIEVLWPTQPGSSIWTQILCTRSSPLGQHATVRKSCLHHNYDEEYALNLWGMIHLASQQTCNYAQILLPLQSWPWLAKPITDLTCFSKNS